jgi:hypothetical protein
MADFTLRDGLRAFWRGFLLGAFAGAAYQLVKNPGTCSCCGCVLAILGLIVVAVVVVAVIQWWTWISFIILLVVAARLVAEHLSGRSRGDAADGDR